MSRLSWIMLQCAQESRYFFKMAILFPLNIFPEVESYGSFNFNLLRNPPPTAVLSGAPMYIPTNNVRGFPCLPGLSDAVVSCLSHDNYSKIWAGVVSWDGLAFPWWGVMLSIFSCLYWPFLTHLWKKMPFQALRPFLNWIICVFCLVFVLFCFAIKLSERLAYFWCVVRKCFLLFHTLPLLRVLSFCKSSSVWYNATCLFLFRCLRFDIIFKKLLPRPKSRRPPLYISFVEILQNHILHLSLYSILC